MTDDTTTTPLLPNVSREALISAQQGRIKRLEQRLEEENEQFERERKALADMNVKLGALAERLSLQREADAAYVGELQKEVQKLRDSYNEGAKDALVYAVENGSMPAAQAAEVADGMCLTGCTEKFEQEVTITVTITGVRSIFLEEEGAGVEYSTAYDSIDTDAFGVEHGEVDTVDVDVDLGMPRNL